MKHELTRRRVQINSHVAFAASSLRSSAETIDKASPQRMSFHILLTLPDEICNPLGSSESNLTCNCNYFTNN